MARKYGCAATGYGVWIGKSTLCCWAPAPRAARARAQPAGGRDRPVVVARVLVCVTLSSSWSPAMLMVVIHVVIPPVPVGAVRHAPSSAKNGFYVFIDTGHEFSNGHPGYLITPVHDARGWVLPHVDVPERLRAQVKAGRPACRERLHESHSRSTTGPRLDSDRARHAPAARSPHHHNGRLRRWR